MKAASREYTMEETRKLFLEHVWVLIDYWDKEKPDKREALEGLAFSILSTLDGSSVVVPAFAVIPAPHEDDKFYLILQGENYYKPFDAKDECDIAGGLHELFYSVKG